MVDHRIPIRLVAGRGNNVAAATALTATLVLAAGGWVVAVHQMSGMDMGVATAPGSFASFVAVWVPMMAAMMLPGAVPAVVRSARLGPLRVAPRFVATYLAIWALVGGPVYAACRPHGTRAAAAIVIAAGIYELTPLKRRLRELSRASVGSGLRFGLCCVGSSIGLMLMLVVLGVMSVTWMAVIAVIVFAQKVLPPRAAVDVPLALTIIGFGVVIAVAPSLVPGLMPSM